MFRKITGTAASTVRFATAIPVGVARSVLERVTHHGSQDDATADSPESPQRQQAPQREPQEQAAQAAKATSATKKAAGSTARKSASTAATKKSATPASTRKKAGTPKAGETQHSDDKPEVVLAVDAPPEEIEPPVDVVGEALAAEKAEESQKPKQPQPVHVNDDNPVVYSTTSDDD